MISVHELPDLSSISNLKAAHLAGLTAPMDGMWEAGFVNASPHWEIRRRGEQAGYFAVNDQRVLLQFYLCPDFEVHGRELFDHVIAEEAVTRAVVSTIDPLYLSLCLDVHTEAKVHTYLYELRAPVDVEHLRGADLDFRPLETAELERTIAFQQACLGGGPDLASWLRHYSVDLIGRRELYVLHRDDDWLGLGELRRSTSQEGVADLGVMVAPQHRGRRWASHVLRLLAAVGTKQGLRLICSTTVENVAAQKAILRSGFISRHRILDVSF